MSPAAGVTPDGYRGGDQPCSRMSVRSLSRAIESSADTANPSVASSIAGVRTATIDLVPSRASSSSQPSTQPGTVMVHGLLHGTSSKPLSRSIAAFAPDPAMPDALRAFGVSSPGRWMRAERSPPGPQVSGRTTPRTAFAAMAPSTAFPPLCMTEMAALLARWWGETAKCVAEGRRPVARGAPGSRSGVVVTRSVMAIGG